MKFRQAALYKKAYIHITSKNESKWVGIFDLDEFLWSPRVVDVKRVLREHEDLSVIGINWLWFGSRLVLS